MFATIKTSSNNGVVNHCAKSSSKGAARERSSEKKLQKCKKAPESFQRGGKERKRAAASDRQSVLNFQLKLNKFDLGKIWSQKGEKGVKKKRKSNPGLTLS